MSKTILGIDVAKKKLDVCLMLEGKALMKKFDNSEKGFKLLAGWLASLHVERVHACLEATGTYGEPVAEFLHERGHVVSVVNPFRIKGFASSDLKRNKTDTADARTIAEFARVKEPEAWHPLPAEVKQLQALTRRIEALERMLVVETNRLEMAPAATRPSIKRMVGNLEEEIKLVQSLIKDHIDNNPDMKQQSGLLQSTRLSKLGSGRIRKALYFPAIAAVRYNEVVIQFARRLRENGKTPMQIIGASMRKLLHIAYGVIKNNRPFDPNTASAFDC